MQTPQATMMLGSQIEGRSFFRRTLLGTSWEVSTRMSDTPTGRGSKTYKERVGEEENGQGEEVLFVVEIQRGAQPIQTSVSDGSAIHQPRISTVTRRETRGRTNRSRKESKLGRGRQLEETAGLEVYTHYSKAKKGIRRMSICRTIHQSAVRRKESPHPRPAPSASLAHPANELVLTFLMRALSASASLI